MARDGTSNFGEVFVRAEKRCGHIPVAGRLHRPPAQIDHSYAITDVVLGSGGSGSEVKLANGKGRMSGLRFAVKTFSLQGLSAAGLRDLESEVEVFLTIDHPHIARLVDVYDAGQHLHLVMEYLEGGELFDRLSERKTFSEQVAAETVCQMLLAVNYLHALGIVHRDLKLENFMYESKGGRHLKLIDFGFSKFCDPKFGMFQSCGTLSYVAPEVLENNYTSQADLWSLGVVTFILLSGCMPFIGTRDIMRRAILDGCYAMKKAEWGKICETGKNFVTSLLNIDAEQRPNAIQALGHPWMRQRAKRLFAMTVDESIAHSLRGFGQASKFRRACLSMMAWSLTNAEQEQVRKDFLEIDKSKEGTITLTELRTLLMNKLEIYDAEVNHIFNALDTNKDQRIHYTDFLAAMVSTRIALHDGLLRTAFDRFDADNSGFITPDNLRQMLGENFEGAEVDQLISEADFKRDGKISYPEFVAFVREEKFIDARPLMSARTRRHIKEEWTRQDVVDLVHEELSGLAAPRGLRCTRPTFKWNPTRQEVNALVHEEFD